MSDLISRASRWIGGEVIRKDRDGFAVVRLDAPAGTVRFGLLKQSTRDYGLVARRITKGSRVHVEVPSLDDTEVAPASAMKVA